MTNICVECGMCCDGTLFTHGTLDTSDNLEPLVAKRALLDLADDRPVLHFPCTALESCRCTIYGSRPQLCGRYRCRLLKQVEAGEVEAGAALEIIAETIRYRDTVKATAEARLEPPDGEALRTGQVSLQEVYAKLHVVLVEDADAEPAERNARLIELAALRMLIDTHFKPRRSPEADA